MHENIRGEILLPFMVGTENEHSNNDLIQNFSFCYFNELYKLCVRVYAEKPEVKNFNEYVKAIVLKDLEQN